MDNIKIIVIVKESIQRVVFFLTMLLLSKAIKEKGVKAPDK